MLLDLKGDVCFQFSTMARAISKDKCLNAMEVETKNSLIQSEKGT